MRDDGGPAGPRARAERGWDASGSPVARRRRFGPEQRTERRARRRLPRLPDEPGRTLQEGMDIGRAARRAGSSSYADDPPLARRAARARVVARGDRARVATPAR